jgi:hypothetical protein
MAQAATILSDGQSLFIQTNQIFTTSSEPQGVRALDGLLIPDGRFPINGRIHLSFVVAPEYKTSFGLLKGLIDFHRSPNFSFTFDRSQHRVDVTVADEDQHLLTSFLQSVHTRLTDELSFKANLKKILQFESDYKRKKDFLYNSLLNMR